MTFHPSLHPSLHFPPLAQFWVSVLSPGRLSSVSLARNGRSSTSRSTTRTWFLLLAWTCHNTPSAASHVCWEFPTLTPTCNYQEVELRHKQEGVEFQLGDESQHPEVKHLCECPLWPRNRFHDTFPLCCERRCGGRGERTGSDAASEVTPQT